jgi:hypothetical protein
VKKFIKIRAYSLRSVPKNQTYDFGEADAADGFGYEISNGKIIEKYQRRNIFFQQHKIVRI